MLHQHVLLRQVPLVVQALILKEQGARVELQRERRASGDLYPTALGLEEAAIALFVVLQRIVSVHLFVACGPARAASCQSTEPCWPVHCHCAARATAHKGQLHGAAALRERLKVHVHPVARQVCNGGEVAREGVAQRQVLARAQQAHCVLVAQVHGGTIYHEVKGQEVVVKGIVFAGVEQHQVGLAKERQMPIVLLV